MDRDKIASENLLDQENKLIAEILAGFRALVRSSTDRVNNTASTGQAASNAMAIEIQTSGLIKSIEDLLKLTRQLRELWVVGPLKKPGEGDTEAQRIIQADAAQFFATLNSMRHEQRLEEAASRGGSMQYEEGALRGRPPTPTGSKGSESDAASSATVGRA